MNETVKELIKSLHEQYLAKNPYDEGDIIFYRINYKLQYLLKAELNEVENMHKEYHKDSPRYISCFFCKRCNAIVNFIPILYYSSEKEKNSLEKQEKDGRIILIPVTDIKENPSLFACRQCREPI